MGYQAANPFGLPDYLQATATTIDTLRQSIITFDAMLQSNRVNTTTYAPLLNQRTKLEKQVVQSGIEIAKMLHNQVPGTPFWWSDDTLGIAFEYFDFLQNAYPIIVNEDGVVYRIPVIDNSNNMPQDRTKAVIFYKRKANDSTGVFIEPIKVIDPSRGVVGQYITESGRLPSVFR